MFDHSCPHCVALFAEMHSAVSEARAYRWKEDVQDWWQFMKSWENARLKLVLASTDYENHLATHHGTPISAKSVAKV
jgi:hypothetical protein